jgi:hypothetical protein
MSSRHTLVCDQCGTEDDTSGFPQGWRRFSINDLITGIAKQVDICVTCVHSVKILELMP